MCEVLKYLYIYKDIIHCSVGAVVLDIEVFTKVFKGVDGAFAIESREAKSIDKFIDLKVSMNISSEVSKDLTIVCKLSYQFIHVITRKYRVICIGYNYIISRHLIFQWHY